MLKGILVAVYLYLASFGLTEMPLDEENSLQGSRVVQWRFCGEDFHFWVYNFWSEFESIKSLIESVLIEAIFVIFLLLQRTHVINDIVRLDAINSLITGKLLQIFRQVKNILAQLNHLSYSRSNFSADICLEEVMEILPSRTGEKITFFIFVYSFFFWLFYHIFFYDFVFYAIFLYVWAVVTELLY